MIRQIDDVPNKPVNKQAILMMMRHQASTQGNESKMSSIRNDAKAKARILAGAHGHKLERPVVYTQGVSLTARLLLSQLDATYANPRRDIEAVTKEYADDPDNVFDGGDGTANYAGVNWTSMMADDPRYRNLLISTADRFMALDDDGFPLALDRDYRVEDMFFAGTIL